VALGNHKKVKLRKPTVENIENNEGSREREVKNLPFTNPSMVIG